MWDVDPLQVGGVVLRYAEEVQVVALLLVADLCETAELHKMCLYKRKKKISQALCYGTGLSRNVSVTDGFKGNGRFWRRGVSHRMLYRR